jgi:uncharacterized membrane protein HdeD (DUF308 family)
MSTRPFPSDLTTIEAELCSKWGWFVALGVVLLVLGILALGNLLVATLASVFFVGIMMILGTIAQVIHAFRMKGWGRFFWLLAGLLYGAAGVIAFTDPALAAVALTLLLAVALIASGVLRIWTGVRLRPASGWG